MLQCNDGTHFQDKSQEMLKHVKCVNNVVGKGGFFNNPREAFLGIPPKEAFLGLWWDFQKCLLGHCTGDWSDWCIVKKSHAVSLMIPHGND